MSTTEEALPVEEVVQQDSACNKEWTAAELVGAVCDALVASGKIRATPAFIRTDREAKIVKVFEAAKLDGAKLLSFASARELEIAIRKITQGESWVDDVVEFTKTYLPKNVAAVTELLETEEVKQARIAYKEQCAARVENGYEGTEEGRRDGGDRRDDRRDGGDNVFGSFGGRRA